MAVAITQTANPASGTIVSNVCTYSSVSIGTASSDRVIIVASGSRSQESTSATIDFGGGDTAMSATAIAESSSSAAIARIFYLAVPTGTTATIKITLAAGTGRSNHIVVYSVTGTSATLNSSGTDISADVSIDSLATGSVTIPNSGGFLALATHGSTDDEMTWSNATENTDDLNGNFRYSTASRVISGTVNITCSTLASIEGALVWAIFDPSGAFNISSGLGGAGNLSAYAFALNQQISAVFAGAGNVRSVLVPNNFQFVETQFGGAGNFRVNVGQRTINGARFLGAVGSLTIDMVLRKSTAVRLGGRGTLSADTIHIQAPLPIDLTLHVGEWPVALPQCPILNAFSEQRQHNIVEFQSDVGFTKLKRRSTMSCVETSVTFRMTDAEVDIFNDWYVNYQDDGTIAFTWDHPITKISYNWKFDTKDAPRIDRATPNTFRVSFNLLRLFN